MACILFYKLNFKALSINWIPFYVTDCNAIEIRICGGSSSTVVEKRIFQHYYGLMRYMGRVKKFSFSKIKIFHIRVLS